MNKFYAIFLAIVFIGGFSACKKESKPQVPAALVGKWYLRQYSITASLAGVADPPYVTPYNDTSTYMFYQFNSDGTGLEQTSSDPNFILLAPTPFTYQVSGTNIIFSHNSTVMVATTSSYEITSGGKLIIRGNYSYPSAGGVVNNLQELTLSK